MKAGKTLAELRWLLLLAATTAAVHFLVLQFVFPGYYSAWWPHHSDFYIPAAIANAHATLAELARAPRPVGEMAMQALGHLGIRGSIAAVIVIAMLDCIGSALLIQRFLGEAPSVALFAGFAAYVFLVFAQPHFYVFYTYDLLSQVSYLILLVAAPVACRYMHGSGAACLAAFGGLAFLAFLTKETYAIPAILLASANAVGSFGRSGRARGLSLLAVLAASLLLALALEAINGSPFTGGASEGGRPYALVLQPVPLFLEWFKYARETFGALLVGLIAFSAALTATLFSVDSRQFAVSLLLPMAGAMSWLANSALPYHHFPGYTSSAAYLVYAPLLLLPAFVRRSRIGGAAGATIMMLAFASPALAKSKYELDSWSLAQEARQKNLLESIDHLASVSGTGRQRVLVTGLNFPFSPFDHGDSLRTWPTLASMHFDVMTYANSARVTKGVRWRGSDVSFVPRSDVRDSSYDRIWAFRSDGTLASAPAPRANDGRVIPLPAEDFVAFPDLQRLLTAQAARGGELLRYLQCGSVLLTYAAFDEAETCFRKALSVSPTNPYPYFYLGVTRERRGDFADARRYFADAVHLDDRERPNPNFRAALSRVERNGR